ncbi:peptidoglycan-binding protein [Pseudosporangium ferrugineum]|uniref:Multidrug efflux pump subunit AcrA (Membrane-fusion protein) n=1 Tax=Pseudosporangium ferrugineum TaxID=439699 RepID=A0A2T0SHP9_9ACTN|nr:peptidoglycan-binding protein [Pseudosporangium ferrugineum]PRY32936.1 multidrug efflux pump subunit AcrA (membrane-fusion protein) [Pseudosporangium ferrugineum]
MRTRTRAWTAVAATVSAGVAAGVVLVTGQGHGDGPAAPAAQEPTVPVTRTDLVQTQQVDGTLGYAGTASVSALRSGTVTWLPQAGDTIGRGEHVYDVDNEPVTLFYGRRPFWRELHAGVPAGPDVRILEQNLRKLGYADGLTVDTTYTDATAAAVRKWQKAHHRERTGRVALGDVVVLPGAIRVSAVSAETGTRAGGKILTATGTRKQVTVDLPAARSALAVKGSRVTVGLPDGRTARGRITAVGTTATAPPGKDGQDGTPTLPVTVALDDPAATGALDGAPVTVDFRGAVHKGVLAVPVDALLALGEGGFGVQVVGGDGVKRIVAVTLGAFANGKVEIRGDGLAAGTRVTVPAT